MFGPVLILRMVSLFDSPVPVILVEDADSAHSDRKNTLRRQSYLRSQSSEYGYESFTPMFEPGSLMLDKSLGSSIDKSQISPTVEAFVLPLSVHDYEDMEFCSNGLSSPWASRSPSPRSGEFTAVQMSGASESPTEKTAMFGAEKPFLRDVRPVISVNYRRKEKSWLTKSGTKVKSILMHCNMCTIITVAGVMATLWVLLSVGLAGYFQFDSVTRRQRSVPPEVELRESYEPPADLYEYLLLPFDHALSDGLTEIAGLVPYNALPSEATPTLQPVDTSKVTVLLKGLAINKPKEIIVPTRNSDRVVSGKNKLTSRMEKVEDPKTGSSVSPSTFDDVVNRTVSPSAFPRRSFHSELEWGKNVSSVKPSEDVNQRQAITSSFTTLSKNETLEAGNASSSSETSVLARKPALVQGRNGADVFANGSVNNPVVENVISNTKVPKGTLEGITAVEQNQNSQTDNVPVDVQIDMVSETVVSGEGAKEGFEAISQVIQFKNDSTIFNVQVDMALETVTVDSEVVNAFVEVESVNGDFEEVLTAKDIESVLPDVEISMFSVKLEPAEKEMSNVTFYPVYEEAKLVDFEKHDCKAVEESESEVAKVEIQEERKENVLNQVRPSESENV